MAKPARYTLRERLNWPWFPFVLFSFLCALLPGFLGAIALGTTFIPGSSYFSHFYPRIKEAHGQAMLMGWGTSMVLGVALQFLPKLRGAKLWNPKLVRWAFYFFAGGTGLRIITPFFKKSSEIPGWRDFSAIGTVVQAIGILLVIIILGVTFFGANKVPVQKKKGFLQILPCLVGVGISFFVAELLWILPAWRKIDESSGAAIYLANQGALRIILFGAVILIGIGMSVRLLPLNFRLRPSSDFGIWASTIFILIGVFFTFLSVYGFIASPVASRLAAMFFALGTISGILTVKIWCPRVPYPDKMRKYNLQKDFAGLGVLSAYCWAAIAAIFLLLFAMSYNIASFARFSTFLTTELALHAMGAGFMTLLIFSVGWKMLPGFGKCLPRADKLLLAAVICINVATALRVFPSFLRLIRNTSFNAIYDGNIIMAAGVLGFVAVGLFIASLFLSWQK